MDETLSCLLHAHWQTVCFAVLAAPKQLSSVPMNIRIMTLQPRDRQVTCNALLEARDFPGQFFLMQTDSEDNAFSVFYTSILHRPAICSVHRNRAMTLDPGHCVLLNEDLVDHWA